MPEKRDFRILIVDDLKDQADSECTLLELQGYACRAAYEVHEALALAAVFQPHVVLLDLAMPHNGFHVADELRKTTSNQLTIIAITGNTENAAQDRAQLAGCDHFLLKPVEPESLVVLIEDLRLRAS